MAEAPDRPFPVRLGLAATEVVSLAKRYAKSLDTAEVKNPHVLYALLNQKGGLGARALEELGIEYPDTARLLRYPPPEGPFPEPLGRADMPTLSSEVLETLGWAGAEAEADGWSEVDPGHILIALSQVGKDVALLLEERGGGPERIRELVNLLRADRGEQAKQDDSQRADRPERLEAVPTHRDGPATEDDMGRGRFAEVLGERMRRVRGEDTERPAGNWRQRWRKRRRDAAEARLTGPFMVHVHAPWGAGKSSLLNFLATDLRNREPRDGGGVRRAAQFLFGRRRAVKPQLSRWIVVPFNAWEHQRLATPWWWLLAAMQRRCGRELWWIDRRRWAWFWLRDVGWRIWNVRIAVLTVSLLAVLVGVVWALDWFGLADESLSTVQTVLLTAGSAAALATTLFTVARGTGRWLAIGSAEGADRFLKRASDPLGVYRRRFRWLVRSTGRPIAVFVDDLDRGRPEYVVELLEGIQTLFVAEPVAYVVAADRAWLYQSFGKAYEDFEETAGDPSRPLGFRFLEKTFQISMEIPPMSDDVRGAFWGSLLSTSPGGEGARGRSSTSVPADAFAELSTQEEVESQAQSLLAAGMEPEDVYAGAVRRFNAAEIEQQTETLLTKFAPLLESNPRSMKRLVNAYGFERDLLVRQGHFLDEEERRQLALLTILRLRWPLFADHLRDNPADADLCAAGNGTAPDDHEFKRIFTDPALRALFEDSVVGTKLDRGLIERFPSRDE
ncbi:MAG TPA: P-loop NTPase fold protein [Solirubrobacterales bacterium]|nr:P-loop NTPase fold protein [Solirubrobacterales bacterium]